MKLLLTRIINTFTKNENKSKNIARNPKTNSKKENQTFAVKHPYKALNLKMIKSTLSPLLPQIKEDIHRNEADTLKHE